MRKKLTTQQRLEMVKKQSSIGKEEKDAVIKGVLEFGKMLQDEMKKRNSIKKGN
jgi:hypothetical protein